MNNIHQINYSSFSLLAIIRQILCNLYLFIIHLAIRNRHIRGGLRVESVLLKPVTKFLLILETAPTQTSSHVVQVPSKQRYWWGLVVIMSTFSSSYTTQRLGAKVLPSQLPPRCLFLLYLPLVNPRQQAGPGGTTAWQGRFVLAVVSSQGRMLLAQVAFEWEMSPFKLLAPGAGGTPWERGYQSWGIRPEGVRSGKLCRGRLVASLLAPTSFKTGLRLTEERLVWLKAWCLTPTCLGLCGFLAEPCSKYTSRDAGRLSRDTRGGRGKGLHLASLQRDMKKNHTEAVWMDRHRTYLLLLLRSDLSLVHLIYKRYVVP